MSGMGFRMSGRVIVWTLAMLYLTSGLVIRQGFGVNQVGGVSLHPLPRWKMFSAVGFGITQVRYWQVDASGQWSELPSSRWIVHGLKAAEKEGRRLCRTLPPGSELRVDARTSSRRGWKNHAEALERDLCSGRR